MSSTLSALIYLNDSMQCACVCTVYLYLVAGSQNISDLIAADKKYTYRSTLK